MWRPRQARDRDQGNAELVAATPLMLGLLVLLVQVGLWAHAQHVSQTIAQHGAAATRALDSSDAQGHARATEVADQLAGELLQEVTIGVQRTDTTATVQVNAYVPTPVPGLDLPVQTVVSAPVERHQTGDES